MGWPWSKLSTYNILFVNLRQTCFSIKSCYFIHWKASFIPLVPVFVFLQQTGQNSLAVFCMLFEKITEYNGSLLATACVPSILFHPPLPVVPHEYFFVFILIIHNALPFKKLFLRNKKEWWFHCMFSLYKK